MRRGLPRRSHGGAGAKRRYANRSDAPSWAALRRCYPRVVVRRLDPVLFRNSSLRRNPKPAACLRISIRCPWTGIDRGFARSIPACRVVRVRSRTAVECGRFSTSTVVSCMGRQSAYRVVRRPLVIAGAGRRSTRTLVITIAIFVAAATFRIAATTYAKRLHSGNSVIGHDFGLPNDVMTLPATEPGRDSRLRRELAFPLRRSDNCRLPLRAVWPTLSTLPAPAKSLSKPYGPQPRHRSY